MTTTTESSQDTGVLVDRVEDTLVVKLHNPAKRNALNIDMRHQITEVLERATGDDQCRAIVLTGTGGHFSAGGDLSAKYESGRFNRERMHGANDTIRAIARSPKPVIAAVDGVSYGIGLSLAAVCDLVVAAGSARFCAPFARVGLAPDGGLHHTLPRRIGHARARRMILTGMVVDAEQAVQWGLADLPAETDAGAAAIELAGQLHERAPLSLAASKAILARTDYSLDEALEAELSSQIRLMDSADFQEGKEAFFDKRKPKFTGQ